MKEEKIDMKDFENRRILGIKRKYEREGYNVIVNPKGSERPAFLKNFQPDIIAKNYKESVIIEVKSGKLIREADYLEELAKLAEENGWRLELVVVVPKKYKVENESIKELTIVEIKERLFEIDKLSQLEHFDSAYLLLWSTFEGAARTKMKNEKLSLINNNPTKIIKNLYSYGIINEEDYRSLEEALKTRNNLAHGYKVGRISITEIELLKEAIRKMSHKL